MVAQPPAGDGEDGEDFDAAQQALMVEIGQALLAQATGGTVALELTVTQAGDGDAVNLDFQVSLERQSGLAVPAAAEDALVDTVQRLVLLWRRHGREPWRGFTYRLTRGPSGPRFTSEFAL
jgi:hypothetical protein